MALEDLALMRAVPGCAVLYPCDGVSTERLVAAAARHEGMVYLRTTRPKTPVIYTAADEFVIGGSKVVRESADDAATVVAAGVTLFEALRAHDELAAEGIAVRVIDAYSVQPVDRDTLLDAARATGGRILTVGGPLRRRRARRRGERCGRSGRLRGGAARRSRDPPQRSVRGAARAPRYLRVSHRSRGAASAWRREGERRLRRRGRLTVAGAALLTLLWLLARTLAPTGGLTRSY